jgi:hypothetical protein
MRADYRRGGKMARYSLSERREALLDRIAPARVAAAP